MSVRTSSTTAAAANVATGNRMSTLLAYSGSVVHVSHAHRVAATGVEWINGTDGKERPRYAKGERVKYRKHDGNYVLGTIDGLSPPAYGTHGMPSGYQVKLDGQENIVDTLAARLMPYNPTAYEAAGDGKVVDTLTRRRTPHNPNAYEATGGGKKYRVYLACR